MARRAGSYDSSGSLKENGARRMANGAAKSSSGRGKRTAMRNRVDAEAEEDHERDPRDEGDDDKDADGEVDADADADGDEDEGENGDHSPKGRKRARVNDEGDSRSTAGGSKAEKRGQTLPRDVDGFIPGSIVRIQLRNFLTYDWVEFRPGPYLNMIFGPNGTGKSSIACAICLGLNFPPAVLGRAQDLKSFVKNDRQEGHIEIELKGAKGKNNVVIRRMLHAHLKSAPFTLNGKSASGKEINSCMAELNVQVSNLCTFLPQDRVAEFARMTPQQLLRETQRAAGNENLTSWHDTLISSGKELKHFQELVAVDREQLKTMEERNANLERDVRRYEERRALEKRIELLELIVPVKEYHEAREVYKQLKPQHKERARAYKRLQKRHAPFMEMMKSMEAELKEREKAREDRKKSAKAKWDQMSKKWDQNEKLEADAEELKNQLDGLKKSEKDRQNAIRRLEKAIQDSEDQLANPPKTENLEEISNQLKELHLDNNQTVERQSELQYKQRQNIEKGSRVKHEINQINTRLQQLDSTAHQKLETLRQLDPDCAVVVEWLRKNGGRFRMEILEPALLSVTVPNRAYTDAVEACFNGTQMRTIVAQCEEDYNLLNRLCLDTDEAVGKRARVNTWYKPVDESRLPPQPVPGDQLRNFGFDGYAIDFIDCPPALKWFLSSEVRMHRTAIALNPRSVDPNQAMEMAARVGGANYIVGRVMNMVTRSKYGKRLPQNTTREIQQASKLVHAAIDPQIKKDLMAKLSEAQAKNQLVLDEEKELSQEDKEIQAAGRKYKESVAKLEARKRAVNETERKIQNIRNKLKSDKGKLETEKNRPSAEIERTNLKQKLLTLASKRVQLVSDYVSLMRSSIKEQEKATRAGLEYLQVIANKAALEEMCKEQATEIEKAQNEWMEVYQRFREAKELSIEKLDISKAKVAAASMELRQQFSEMDEAKVLDEKSATEWDVELAQKREELEMNMATNANVVEQYNRRQNEIEALNATIEERERRVNKIEQSIKLARDNWQPELQKLVSSIGKKFSSAFDRIGCAGEIKIREDEDYDKWAIDIMVKFRDHEKLQLLTGERQSGGERSLTTILYLMSLTEEARAPFSLVDEINQGMDQRAERAVHNSLVEVTCKPDSGQYFLITPKLLPDLHYHERMKILCVNNGEWLPEENGMGNLMGLIDAYMRFSHNSGNANA